MMDWDQIRRNWRAVCEEIKLTWGNLSEDDLALINGDRDRLAAMLKKRYGYETVVVEDRIDQFAQRLDG